MEYPFRQSPFETWSYSRVKATSPLSPNDSSRSAKKPDTSVSADPQELLPAHT